jgi:predicted nucleotidyltransferase
VANAKTFLDEKRDALAALRARFNVEQLEIFGSALREDFNPDRSDLDFLVQFKPLSGYERVDTYFNFRDEPRALFDRDVDLVMSEAIKNRYISQEIERTKKLLYAA